MAAADSEAGEKGALRVEIVTPQGLVLDETADALYAPGTKGEFGALPGHQPYLVALEPGPVRVQRGGSDDWYAITGGLAEVTANHVIVLADACEQARDIDADRAKAAQKRADDRLRDFAKDSDVDTRRARAALARATARLGAANRAG
jgi:F-type H+-transporting ATPase subunit epsilon